MPTQPYDVYLIDISYFSGKLESYLRYKRIPFRAIYPDDRMLLREVYRHTGLMKVPAVRTPESQWLRDTTPMIEWFESRHPQPAVFPSDPAHRFLSQLLEDYADEWLWRPAMYYRWEFTPDRVLNRRRAAREILRSWPLPSAWMGLYFAHRQRRIFVHGDGVNTDTIPHVEFTYLNCLDALESILADRPYLTGKNPTLVDFAFMGPMFRHFSIDPTPARIMRDRSPGVYAWAARLWNARALHSSRTLHLSDTAFTHPGWQYFWREIENVYLPYLHANARAFQNKQSRFDFALPMDSNVIYRRLPVYAYRVWCREVLRRKYNQLPGPAHKKLKRLAPASLLSMLMADADVSSELDADYSLPLAPRTTQPDWWHRLLIFLTGTPRDMPERARSIAARAKNR
ncbi:MAG: glutathione S-transferase family protein [Leptospiraceae bacterium]|nr:glutathione S-transferase family protein [Leptospiraceae bacterium]